MRMAVEVLLWAACLAVRVIPVSAWQCMLPFTQSHSFFARTSMMKSVANTFSHHIILPCHVLYSHNLS